MAQQWAKFLSRSIVVECEVYVADFKELRYQGGSIGDIFKDQGLIG